MHGPIAALQHLEGLFAATRGRPALKLAALVLALSLPAGAAHGSEETSDGADGVSLPSGYRMADFRAPVPDRVPGARTVSTLGARHLLDAGHAVFIDVLRATRKPHGLPADTLWLPKKRRNIPGTLWLPDVGFGVLSDELEAYFRANLERATGSDLDHPIVIYCLADCWMSWNAAKRAASYGYTAVNWYPEGTDGWEAAGYPLLESHPVPVR